MKRKSEPMDAVIYAMATVSATGFLSFLKAGIKSDSSLGKETQERLVSLINAAYVDWNERLLSDNRCDNRGDAADDEEVEKGEPALVG